MKLGITELDGCLSLYSLTSADDYFLCHGTCLVLQESDEKDRCYSSLDGPIVHGGKKRLSHKLKSISLSFSISPCLPRTKSIGGA